MANSQGRVGHGNRSEYYDVVFFVAEGEGESSKADLRPAPCRSHSSLPTITHNMIRTSVRRITSNARMFKRLQSGGSSEGATVTSKGGISDKEKAVENQWARMHVSRPPCIVWNWCNHITNKLCVFVG
jgi:hypothetical protein